MLRAFACALALAWLSACSRQDLPVDASTTGVGADAGADVGVEAPDDGSETDTPGDAPDAGACVCDGSSYGDDEHAVACYAAEFGFQPAITVSPLPACASGDVLVGQGDCLVQIGCFGVQMAWKNLYQRSTGKLLYGYYENDGFGLGCGLVTSAGTPLSCGTMCSLCPDVLCGSTPLCSDVDAAPKDAGP